MLTIPTDLWPFLLSPQLRPVEVYEIVLLDGSTLYFGSQDVTWDGHSYVGLVVQRTSIKFTMEIKAPDCEVTFSNVTNPLRSYLYPTDLLTGARLTVRLLFRDGSDALRSGSFVLFIGRIEPPRKITETAFALSVVGLLDGAGLEIPSRRFAVVCPWDYANKGTFDGGGHCSYQSNTTASGAGTASTALTLASASTFENYDVIQIGGGAPVTITSGGGGTSITLSDPRTWSNGATVRYSDCDRSRSACEKRSMLHRFGGFPGVATSSRTKVLLSRGVPIHEDQPQRPARQQSKNLSDQRVAIADTTSSLPIFIGRLRVEPKVIEIIRDSVSDVEYRVLVYGVCEGPIDSVVDAWADSKKVVDVVAASIKTFGIYYRVGDVGVNDIETLAEYAADAVTRLRAQNRDYRSLDSIGTANSETVYVTFIQKVDADVVLFPKFEVDVKAMLLQAYNADGSASGSPVWSPNPIWGCVAIAISDRFGVVLALADVDVGTSKAEADYCAAGIYGTEASTKVAATQASPTTYCKVKSTEGFIVGKRVDVATVANTCADIISDHELTLGTAVTQTFGDIVVQRPSRFEAHCYLDSAKSATDWLRRILASCRGYVTYDAGRIQFRIERDTVKDLIVNGAMELWSSSTNADSWTETISGACTVNREASIIHGGIYSMRLDRVDSGNLWASQAIGSLEPGRWYRLYVYARRGANATQIRVGIQNATKSKDFDGSTMSWGSVTKYAINVAGTTSFTLCEITFRIDESFASTDAYTVFLYGETIGASVYFDDVSLRGPYAGDFREFTTPLLMGWKEGSFAWSVDKKDRETNRVDIQLQNRSGELGRDEIAVNDFVHQRKHPVKTLRLDGDALDSRDQGYRVAKWALDKRRKLGPGCEFIGSPAALALQPGDIIPVSHTVPNWAAKEQRVSEIEILGLGDSDEHFVKVSTEDYDETIYGDVGPPQAAVPPATTYTLVPVVTRHTGGVLGLAWTLSISTSPSMTFTIHKSSTTGFTPDVSNQIGETRGLAFTYVAREDELDVVAYYRVIARRTHADVVSDEFSTTIYSAGAVAANNLLTGSDFNDASLWEGAGAASAYTDNFQFPTSLSTPDSLVGQYFNEVGGAASLAKVNDGNDATYLKGSATATAGISDANNSDIRYYSFGAGTGKTGRPMVRGKRTGVKSGVYGIVDYYYTLDRTAGTPTWVLWLTLAGGDVGTLATYYGPELTGVDYTKFAMRSRTRMTTGGVPDREVYDFNMAVAFDEKATVASYGSVGENKGTIQGDGSAYGSLTAVIPNILAGQILFASGSVNGCTIQFKKHVSGDTLDGNPIVVEIEDTSTGTKWTALTIPSSEVTAAWRAAFVTFTPGSNVSGSLAIRVKTKNTKAIDVDKGGLTQGGDIFIWQPSPQEIGSGYLGDFSNGRITGYASGVLVVDTPVYSAVA